MVKNPPASARDMRDLDTFPRSRRSLEKEMATHSSVCAWRIPGTEATWRATLHRVAKSDTTEAA